LGESKKKEKQLDELYIVRWLKVSRKVLKGLINSALAMGRLWTSPVAVDYAVRL
jgi:hypothetical protein